MIPNVHESWSALILRHSFSASLRVIWDFVRASVEHHWRLCDSEHTTWTRSFPWLKSSLHSGVLSDRGSDCYLMAFEDNQEQADIIASWCYLDLMVGRKMAERVLCPIDGEVQRGDEMVRRGWRKQWWRCEQQLKIDINVNLLQRLYKHEKRAISFEVEGVRGQGVSRGSWWYGIVRVIKIW